MFWGKRKNEAKKKARNSFVELLQGGEHALAQGDFHAAMRQFNQALEQNSQHESARLGALSAYRGLIAEVERQDDNELLEIYCEKAHQISPNDLPIHELLAKVRKHNYENTAPKSGYGVPDYPYLRVDNLVLQGGGIKGLAYIGAIDALRNYIDLNKVVRYAGASAGGIAAGLLAVGYNVEEYERLIKEVDFMAFLDSEHQAGLLRLVNEFDDIKRWGKDLAEHAKKVIDTKHRPSTAASAGIHLSKAQQHDYAKLIKGMLNELQGEHLGLFPGDVFREQWVEKYIQRKLGLPYATFREAEQLRKENPTEFGFLKEVAFVGVNLNTGAIQEFSLRETPDVIISDAIRITMSIPLIFYPHQAYIKDSTGQRVPHSSRHFYVDGGMLDNFPLWLFDKACYLNDDANDKQALVNPYTLGLRLVTKERLEAYHQDEVIEEPMHKTFPEYLFRLINIIYGKQESDFIKRNDLRRTILIDYLGINTVAFDLGEADQKALMESGQNAVERFFNRLIEQEAELFTAIASGDEWSLHNLLKQGVSMDAKDLGDSSVLDVAFKANQLHLLISLLDAGASITQYPKEILAKLHEAEASPWLGTSRIRRLIKQFSKAHQLNENSIRYFRAAS